MALLLCFEVSFEQNDHIEGLGKFLMEDLYDCLGSRPTRDKAKKANPLTGRSAKLEKNQSTP